MYYNVKPHFVYNFHRHKAICIKMNMINIFFFVSNTIYVFFFWIKNDDIFSNIFSEMFFHDLLETSHKIYAITQSYSLNSSNLFLMILFFYFMFCIKLQIVPLKCFFFVSLMEYSRWCLSKLFPHCNIISMLISKICNFNFNFFPSYFVQYGKLFAIKIQLKSDLYFFIFWIISLEFC